MTVEYRVCDVFDGLADLEDGSIDLIVTSPPFLALRSYLPADHPDKGKEIGSEKTPAEFIDVMLRLSAEFRRVLAPHGSLCVELGDTYAGSGGAGGDYGENGWREHQTAYQGSGRLAQYADDRGNPDGMRDPTFSGANTLTGAGQGWPLAKSKTLIPQLFEVALAYGFNPLTGQESPAGKWRVRNVVTWARPNPPVGALGDKWRPATSDVVVACTSDKRFWDDLATRRPYAPGTLERGISTRPEGNKTNAKERGGGWSSLGPIDLRVEVGGTDDRDPFLPPASPGAPLLDYWVIPPGGYPGSHYAVYPPELVVPLVKAMCPGKVCRECGEPSRPIVEKSERYAALRAAIGDFNQRDLGQGSSGSRSVASNAGGYDLVAAEYEQAGFTDCGHDDYRPGRVLDPFAGSGTTLLVAHGHGFDSIGFDLDARNLELARERVGPMFFREVGV